MSASSDSPMRKALSKMEQKAPTGYWSAEDWAPGVWNEKSPWREALKELKK